MRQESAMTSKVLYEAVPRIKYPIRKVMVGALLPWTSTSSFLLLELSTASSDITARTTHGVQSAHAASYFYYP